MAWARGAATSACSPAPPCTRRRSRPSLSVLSRRMARIGLLTGGGDCPGLNAVIRAIVRKGINVHGHELVGFRGGWQGVLDNDTMALDLQSTRGILPRGGTILRTSRTNVFKCE